MYVVPDTYRKILETTAWSFVNKGKKHVKLRKQYCIKITTLKMKIVNIDIQQKFQRLLH